MVGIIINNAVLIALCLSCPSLSRRPSSPRLLSLLRRPRRATHARIHTLPHGRERPYMHRRIVRLSMIPKHSTANTAAENESSSSSHQPPNVKKGLHTTPPQRQTTAQAQAHVLTPSLATHSSRARVWTRARPLLQPFLSLSPSSLITSTFPRCRCSFSFRS